MKPSVLLCCVALSITITCGYSQSVRIDDKVIKAEFYNYYLAGPRSQKRITDMFIQKGIDSIQRVYAAEKAFAEYKRASGITLTSEAKEEITSEALGFWLYMVYNKKQIDSIRREPARDKWETETAGEVIYAYLNQQHLVQHRPLEYFYVREFDLDEAFYEYLCKKNRGRRDFEFTGTSAAIGTTEYWTEAVTKPVPAKYGYLEVTSDVDLCTIEIDGKPESRTNDRLAVPIPASEKVTVVVKKDGYITHSETVSLTNGGWTKVSARMKKKN